MNQYFCGVLVNKGDVTRIAGDDWLAFQSRDRFGFSETSREDDAVSFIIC